MGSRKQALPYSGTADFRKSLAGAKGAIGKDTTGEPWAIVSYSYTTYGYYYHYYYYCPYDKYRRILLTGNWPFVSGVKIFK